MVSSVSGVLKTYEVHRSEERRLSQKAGRTEENKDTVAISGRARDYQYARHALQSVPDVREDLVSAAAKKYGANANAVSDSDLADIILNRI